MPFMWFGLLFQVLPYLVPKVPLQLRLPQCLVFQNQRQQQAHLVDLGKQQLLVKVSVDSGKQQQHQLGSG